MDRDKLCNENEQHDKSNVEQEKESLYRAREIDYEAEIKKIIDEISTIRPTDETIVQQYEAQRLSRPLFLLLLSTKNNVFFNKYYFGIAEFATYGVSEMLQGFYEAYKKYPELRVSELLTYKLFYDATRYGMRALLVLDQFVMDRDNRIAPFDLLVNGILNAIYSVWCNKLRYFHNLEDRDRNQITSILDKYKHYIKGYSSSIFEKKSTQVCSLCSKRPFEDDDLIEFDNELLCDCCYFYRMAEKHRLLYEYSDYSIENKTYIHHRYYLTSDGKYFHIAFSNDRSEGFVIHNRDFVDFAAIEQLYMDIETVPLLEKLQHTSYGYIRVVLDKNTVFVAMGDYGSGFATGWQCDEKYSVECILQNGIGGFYDKLKKQANPCETALGIWGMISKRVFVYAYEKADGDENRFKAMYEF